MHNIVLIDFTVEGYVGLSSRTPDEVSEIVLSFRRTAWTRSLANSQKPRSVRGFCTSTEDSMPLKLVASINPVRLETYRQECARSSGVAPESVPSEQVAALYVWQTALSAAWFENLAYTEAVLRHAMDGALRDWNRKNSNNSEDWLCDPDRRLASLVKKAASDAEYRAKQAEKRRHNGHPRKGIAPTLDDLVSQLSFGNLSHLLSTTPPTNRMKRGTGFNQRENLWISGLANAFPKLTLDQAKGWAADLPESIPDQVVPAYAVGQAVDRLVRLRNRVGHHEQILEVNHGRLRRDMYELIRATPQGDAVALSRLDRVARTLAMKPVP